MPSKSVVDSRSPCSKVIWTKSKKLTWDVFGDMSLVVFCDFGGSSREVVTSKTSGARHSVIETSFNNHQNWILLVINFQILWSWSWLFRISDNISWWRSISLRLMSDQMFLTTIVPTSWYKAGALIQVKGWWSKETALGSKSAQVQTLYQLLRSGRGNQTLIDACRSRYSLQPTTAKI